MREKEQVWERIEKMALDNPEVSVLKNSFHCC